MSDVSLIAHIRHVATGLVGDGVGDDLLPPVREAHPVLPAGVVAAPLLGLTEVLTAELVLDVVGELVVSRGLDAGGGYGRGEEEREGERGHVGLTVLVALVHIPLKSPDVPGAAADPAWLMPAWW